MRCAKPNAEPRLRRGVRVQVNVDPVRLARECPTACSFEAAILETLAREIGFDAAFFGMNGEGRAPTSYGLDAAKLAAAWTTPSPYASELSPVKAAALRAGGVAVDTDVLGASRVRKSRYHRDFAAPIGGRHSLMAYLTLRGDVVGGVMLGRCGSSFAESDIARVASMLPDLGVARASFRLPRDYPPPQLDMRAPSVFDRLLRTPRTRATVRTKTVDIEIRDGRRYREMVASRDGERLVWSRGALRDASESGWPYVDLFHLAAALAKRRERALFIGCGGGIAMHQFARVYPGVAMDVVEREPAVIELARAWFALSAIPGLRVHVDDGLRFVTNAAAGQWDVAIVDAYDADARDGAFEMGSFLASLRRVLRFDETYSPSAIRNVVVIAH
jgi:hypothetical protein